MMKEKIKERARELGFDDCRITTAQPPASSPQFHQWLAKECHGEMGYLERNAHKRIEPQKVLAEAKSIITLAVSYAGEVRGSCVTQHPTRNTPHGLISRYARFTDYHNTIGERLKLLTDFINQLGGEATR